MATNILDVFSGVGGLALGWTRLSNRPVKHVGAIDCDDALSDCYRHNFAGTPFIKHRFGDPFGADLDRELTRVLEGLAATVDVLLASPPCQPFSAAGKRCLDPQAYLGFHVCSLVEYLAPALVVVENVPQFGRAFGGRLAGRMRVRLGKAGYATSVLTVDALRFGLPQRRVRTLLLAVRRTAGVIRALDQAVSSLRQRDANCGDEEVVTTAEAIGDLPRVEAGGGFEEFRLEGKPSSTYQRRLRQRNGVTYNHVAANHSVDMVARMRRVGAGETPQNDRGHPMRPKNYFRLAYARLAPDEPAATITTNTHNPGSGRFLHYRDHRTLTVREVARLQGFPDAFRFIGSQGNQRRHVGNAVPPLLSQQIAEALTAAEL